jgi:hypothetical protein
MGLQPVDSGVCVGKLPQLRSRVAGAGGAFWPRYREVMGVVTRTTAALATIRRRAPPGEHGTDRDVVARCSAVQRIDYLHVLRIEDDEGTAVRDAMPRRRA